MGSGSVGFNLAMGASRLKHAVMGDINEHVVRLYQDIRDGRIVGEDVLQSLTQASELIRKTNGEHYYEIRERFNQEHNPVDLITLSRTCFNGVMRFNRRGEFNVPFCRNINRLSDSHINSVVSMVNGVSERLSGGVWDLWAGDYREMLEHAQIREGDILYLDPPYIDLSVGYYNNTWNLEDEKTLFETVSNSGASFILSTWASKQSTRGGHRENPHLKEIWGSRYKYVTTNHHYTVGAGSDTYGKSVEALVVSDDIAESLQAQGVLDA